jgi:hypothetical protein
MFEYELIERAKASRRHVVLPEGEDDRVLRAAEMLLRRSVAELTILGNPDDLRARAAGLGVDLGGAQVVDPLTSPLREQYAGSYFDLRKHRGETEEVAFDVVGERTQKDWRKIANHLYEVEWEIALRNHKKADQTVTVIEPVPGDWQVLSSTHRFDKIESHTLKYDIPVPKEGAAKLVYRLRIRY